MLAMILFLVTAKIVLTFKIVSAWMTSHSSRVGAFTIGGPHRAQYHCSGVDYQQKLDVLYFSEKRMADELKEQRKMKLRQTPTLDKFSEDTTDAEFWAKRELNDTYAQSILAKLKRQYTKTM